MCATLRSATRFPWGWVWARMPEGNRPAENAKRDALPEMEVDRAPARAGGIRMADDKDRSEPELAAQIEQLRASEARMSRALQMAHAGYWDYDVERDLFTFNDDFYRIFRTTAAEVGGYQMSSADYARRFIHPADAGMVAEEVRAAIEATDPDFERQVEHRILYADGRIGHMTVRFFIVKDEQGRTVRTYGVNQDVTERKRAEEAVRSNEARYRGLFAHTHTGVAMYTPVDGGTDFVFVDFNQAGCRIERLRRQDVVGRRLTAVFPGVRDFGLLEVLQRVWSSGVPERFPLKQYVDDRIVGWRDNYVYRLPTGEVVAVYQDLTEQKRAEEARERSLRELDRRHRVLEYLLEAANVVLERGDFVVSARRVFDSVKEISEARSGLVVLFGENQEPDEVLFSDPGERSGAIGPPLPEPLQRVCAEVERTGRVAVDNHLAAAGSAAPAPDGGAEPENALFAPLNLEGRTVGVIGLLDKPGGFTDEDRRVAEAFGQMAAVALRSHRDREALRESEERYRALFDRSRDLVYLCDFEGRFIDANDAALELFNVERSEVPTLNFASFLDEEQLARAFEATREIRKTGTQKNITEYRLRTKNGDEVFVETKGSMVYSRGKPVGILAVARDVTEKKKLEASVAQSDRLASMGILAAGVAHEINNPLAYVLYNIESLAEDLPGIADTARRCYAALRERLGEAALDEMLGGRAELLLPPRLDDAVDRAREALGGTRRIRDISKTLGAFSRVEGAEISQVDLNFAVQSAVSMTLNEVRFRARLFRDLGRLPRIQASEGKLSQVFLNLLINAAQAIDEGDVESNQISVRTWREGKQVYAEVEDTGRGIRPEDLPHIFQPFFTTKELGKGSGLGLAICRNIIDELGGEIDVRSEVGKGTRVRVRLPIAGTGSKTPGYASTTPEESSPTARGRILVVDDERPIRAALQRIFGREHEVVPATSGAEARTILEQDRGFDLILCDLMMPEMSGMELHEWLAERDPALADRMVFITGGAFTPRAAEFLGRVDNLRLEKPFDRVDLKKLVDSLILAAKNRS